MTMHDTKAAYLTLMVELQLNRKGYFIQREVRYGDRRVDALAEGTEVSARKNSLPIRFAIEFKVFDSGTSPGRVEKAHIPWLGGPIDVFSICLYPSKQEVRVPKILRKAIKSEQSMTVKILT